ncbi:hypothetical protein KUCAC02_023215, partial [Chaenocephalus aceratus]
VMESQQLGQIRGDGADHPGGRMQLCNGSENGDKAPIEARGDVFRLCDVDRLRLPLFAHGPTKSPEPGADGLDTLQNTKLDLSH